MVNLVELIDFCCAKAPPGYAQDSNDQEYAKQLAERGQLKSLLFTYDSFNSIVISLRPFAIEIRFDLTDMEIQMQPFLEFAEKLRQYIIAHSP